MFKNGDIHEAAGDDDDFPDRFAYEPGPDLFGGEGFDAAKNILSLDCASPGSPSLILQ